MQTADATFERPDLGEKGQFGEFQEVHDIAGPPGIYGGLESVFASQPSVYDLETMLLRDSQAMALERVQVQTIMATIPRIEKGGEGDTGEAEFARKVFLRAPHEGGMTTPLRLVLAQACGAFARRRSFFEKVWDVDEDGDIVIKKLALRRASTCEIDTDDHQNYDGFTQKGFRKDGSLFKERFEKNKAWVYIHGHSSSAPLKGESTFEAAYHNHINKAKLQLLFFMYLQKYGIPPINAHVDSPVRKDQEAMLKKAEAIRAGSTVVTGPGESFGTITSAQTVGGSQGGTADFREAIRYLDAQMATGMLAGFLQLPVTNQTGSYALSRDSSDLFLLSLEAKQSELETSFTYDPMAEVIFHKFGANAVYPRLKLTALSQEHEAKALELFKAVLTTGNAPPMPIWLFNLLRDRAFGNLDINEDQIQAAQEMYEEALKAAGEPGGHESAVASIVAAPAASLEPAPATNGSSSNGSSASASNAQVAAEEAIATHEAVQLIYNPARQGRQFGGKFGGAKTPFSNPPVRTGGATGSARPSTRGGGSSSSGVGRRGAGAATRLRPAPIPDTPEANQERQEQKPGAVVLPSGEEVELSTTPIPGEHYLAVGLRGGVPAITFFGVMAQGRALEATDVSAIVTHIAHSFEGGVNIVGRYQGDTANLALVSSPPEGEMDTILNLIRTSYGAAGTGTGRMILDGEEVV